MKKHEEDISPDLAISSSLAYFIYLQNQNCGGEGNPALLSFKLAALRARIAVLI